MNEIMVSVICLAYNHEKYIEECLEGLVKQEVNFKYEVLINDDCSTDETAQIIRRYEEKYPEIIKATYQKQNLYSQGGRIVNDILLPQAKGKYIAKCEGDDYWLDEDKLQTQVDFMEAHPDCSFCFGDYWVVEESNPEIKKPFEWNSFWHGEGVYTCEEMIEMNCPQMTTFLFPRALYPDMEAFKNLKVRAGDKVLAVVLTAKGYAYGMERRMTVYRKNVPDSVTAGWRKNLESFYTAMKGLEELYDIMDKYTDYQYSAAFAREKRKCFIEEKSEIAEENIATMSEKHKILYIYGAGAYAHYCAMYMYGHGIAFQGFVVSDGRKLEEEKLGYPVYELHEIENNSEVALVLALNNEHLDQVKGTLQGYSWVVGCYEK